jgi:dihydrofolate reductase
MRCVIYSMGVSLDGYIVGPDGDFDWTAPDQELFRLVTDQTRELAAYVMGRRLRDDAVLGDGRPGSVAGRRRPRVGCDLEAAPEGHVLHYVVGRGGECPARHRRPVEATERLRAEPADGDIAIGGAGLAGEAARLDLIDEYRPRMHPVLVGSGIPFYSQSERRVDLQLIESLPFGSQTSTSATAWRARSWSRSAVLVPATEGQSRVRSPRSPLERIGIAAG